MPVNTIACFSETLYLKISALFPKIQIVKVPLDVDTIESTFSKNCLFVLNWEFLQYLDLSMLKTDYVVGDKHFLSKTSNLKNCKIFSEIEKMVEERKNLLKNVKIGYFPSFDNSIHMKSFANSLGAILITDFDIKNTKKVDYIISDLSFHYSSKKPKKLTAKVLEKEWIGRCFQSCEIVNTKIYEFKPPFFGQIVSVTGLSEIERNKIKRTIIEKGGKYSGPLNKKCTLLLSKKPEGRKYQFAKSNGIKTMHPNYIDCFLQSKGNLSKKEMKILEIDNFQIVENSPILKIEKNRKRKKEKMKLLCEHIKKQFPENCENENNKKSLSSSKLSKTFPEDEKSENLTDKRKFKKRFVHSQNEIDIIVQKKNAKGSCHRQNQNGQKELDFYSQDVAPLSSNKRENAFNKDEDFFNKNEEKIEFDDENGDYLSSICVFLTGLNDEDFRKSVQIIRASGATRLPLITEELTHIVCGSEEFSNALNKAKLDIDMVDIVSFEWLSQCYRQKREIGTEKYLLKKNVSEKKSDFGEFNKNISTFNNDNSTSKKSKVSEKGFKNKKNVCRKIFVLSGLSQNFKDLLGDKIESLGGTVVEDVYNDEAKEKCSHLICGNVSRSIKVITAIVRGIWFLILKT
ncbi:hypothetical protein MHBO_002218 [Bonamia ostreae]|uniref:BRCT domain-containing protein n=1 Tax=Bonamia ostreae TaxID=126728 RepID=A0ABV2AME5_9EUKA